MLQFAHPLSDLSDARDSTQARPQVADHRATGSARHWPVQPRFGNADRALRRNADKSADDSFEVRQAFFDGAQAAFKPPTEAAPAIPPAAPTVANHG